MAAVAAAVAAASSVLSTFHLSRHPSFTSHQKSIRGLCPRIRVSLISSPSTTEESNTTFTPARKSKPKTLNHKLSEEESGRRVNPWVVRGPKGNITLQKHIPVRSLHSITEAERREKKKEKASSSKTTAAEPKYSKAARRFYNERFREPPQRLSKVLAAAGGSE